MTEYLSVTEFASLHGKDPGNIRRLLADGRIEGQKIGKQWVIPASTQYPADQREKTGAYRNWRQRIKLNKNKMLMENINQMIAELRLIYGEQLTEAILYGSYARGDYSEESDVDIAIILQGKADKTATESMINCVAEYELKCGKVLSVIDIEKEKFEAWKRVLPFYKNVQREGIQLWKAAI